MNPPEMMAVENSVLVSTAGTIFERKSEISLHFEYFSAFFLHLIVSSMITETFVRKKWPLINLHVITTIFEYFSRSNWRRVQVSMSRCVFILDLDPIRVNLIRWKLIRVGYALRRFLCRFTFVIIPSSAGLDLTCVCWIELC